MILIKKIQFLLFNKSQFST